MSDKQFLPPAVRLSQAFECDDSRGSGITRRTFIKRMGGATVATMVAWNLTANEARAEGDGSGDGSGSGWWDMKCSLPSSGSGTVNVADDTPGGIGAFVASLELNLTTSKIEDEPESQG